MDCRLLCFLMLFCIFDQLPFYGDRLFNCLKRSVFTSTGAYPSIMIFLASQLPLSSEISLNSEVTAQYGILL